MSMKYLVIILMIFVAPFVSFGQNEESPKKTESPKGDDIPIGSFTGGLVVGFNAAQIDGDNLYGYNKLAILAGARVGYRVSKNWIPAMGIFYNQKGSRSELVLSGSFYEKNESGFLINTTTYNNIPKTYIEYIEKIKKIYLGIFPNLHSI